MLTINQGRTFKAPVAIFTHNANGELEQGQFSCVFKIIPLDKIKQHQNLLDAVLVSVSDLRMNDCDDKPLSNTEILTAVKLDPQISLAIISTYNEQIAKKNLRPI